MDSSEKSYGWIIILFLFFILFGGGNGLFGWNGRNERGYICDDISNCDVRTSEIRNTATTQFLIEQKAAETNAIVQATSNVLGQKIDFYEFQNLRDQLAEARTRNIVLENKLYTDAQFNAISAQNAALANQIQALGCELPKRIPTYACGVVPCNQSIVTGCGSTTSTTAA